jgi:hypothetical protein
MKSKDKKKSGPLVIELDDSSYQLQVLRVFIYLDLTYRERASLKLLLDKRKKLDKKQEDKSPTFLFVIIN